MFGLPDTPAEGPAAIGDMSDAVRRSRPPEPAPCAARPNALGGRVIGLTPDPGSRFSGPDAMWPDLAAVRQGQAVAVCTVPTDPPPPGGWPAWLDRLDEGERRRAARFHRASDRDSYIAAHALVRAMLSACQGPGGPAPAAWHFVAGRNGKPGVRDGTLSFNLSHTSGLAACAVGLGPDIGIDVETIGRSGDTREILAECLTPAEALALDALPEGARMERFLELWTLKEALSKATGEGLGLAFDAIGFDLVPPRLATAPADIGDNSHWQFMQWRPGPGHVAALALRRADAAPLAVVAWSAPASEAWPA